MNIINFTEFKEKKQQANEMQEDLMDLLVGLMSNSYPDKLEKIESFFQKHPQENQEKQKELIATYKARAEKQSSCGREHKLKIKEKVLAKKGIQEKKTYDKPYFNEYGKGHGTCAKCNAKLPSGAPKFYLKSEVGWSLWCPSMACFPDQYFDYMKSNGQWIKFINKKINQ